ncbi:choice-of-anchor Q domain-containing protein [Agarivorans sp. MS3-6]|uniref:right-handed parallel beta-helix repeat-containing protein n=1 Tax=Agarivorans sp. TSD2052 TaxID=2937286 RepID=UPI00200D8B56|nr:right-handed parallel beta-helix repeat-containing protein [Agarivorans sp. TSD2052]UPW19743.1 right-handed parallel beta-helix repeat-containing protein [Agarivorans sp. TSD2052]
MYCSSTVSKFFLSSLAILSLVACGGGGGDGGGTSISTPEVSAELLMEQYQGSTKSASLTADDIYPTLQYLFNGDTTPLLQSSAKHRINKVNRAKLASDTVSARASETQSCPYGGSVTISENLNQNTGVGKYQENYKNCDDGSVVYSGRIVFDYHKWDLSSLQPINFDIYYDDFREQSGTEFTLLRGVVDISGMSTCEQSITSNMLLTTDKVSVLEKDLVATYYSCIDDDEQRIAGRIYFSDKGYVDLVTPEPIVVDYDDNLQSGTLTLTSERSEVVLNADNAFVHVSVDSNRDGMLEVDTKVPAWYLNDQNYSDIADDDGDGIPNSWEIAKGLDPNFSNDGVDSDQDGFIDYYEYLADRDPKDFYSYPYFDVSIYNYLETLFVEENATIDLYLYGAVDQGLLPLVNGVLITMPLPSVHSWSVSSSKHGCVIEESEDGSQLLSCPNIDLSNIESFAGDDLLVQLNVVFKDTTIVNTQANLDLDFPFSRNSLNMYIEPIRSDLALWVSDYQLGFELGTLKDKFDYSFRVNADPRGSIYADRGNIRGKLNSHNLGLSIASVSVDYSNAKCTVSELEFECFDISWWDEFTVQLNKPAAMGKAELELEVDTIYRPNLIRTTQSHTSFSFGQNMSVLQAVIDNATTIDVDVESGIYLGHLSIDKPLQLKANPNVELWLQPEESDYYAEGAITSNHFLSLDGFAVYLGNSNFQIASGAFTNNRFYLDGNSGGIIVSSGGLLFNSNKVVQSSVEYSSYLSLIESQGDTSIDNNLFSFESDNSVYIWTSGYWASSNTVIQNNTLVNVYGVINYTTETRPVFQNNLVVRLLEPDYSDEYFLQYVSDENNILPNRYTEYANANNIFTDTPGVDPENGYRLLPDSIAIDNGLDLSDSITTDLDGNTRPSGSAFDIGAYEYQY